MVSRRVLIVESSIMVRRGLADAVQSHHDLEVVALVSSGGFALAKIASTRPDAVVLGLDPPNSDTHELIAAVHERFPEVDIVVCSSAALDRRGRRELFTAGVTSFVSRPESALCRTTFLAAIQAPLVEALLRGPPPVRPSLPQIVPETRTERRPDRPEVCVIGASTGGPNALSELFRHLPRPEVPLIVVQHMPPVFTTQLAKRLSGEGEIPFVEVTDGMRAQPRRGYLAPGDFHVELDRDAQGLVLRLSHAPPENSVRPSVDVLFTSVAKISGSRVVGVVLTGMGADGCRGAGAIRAAGGHIVAQDQASSTVWGMPGSVVHAGHANAVLPLSQIGEELKRRLPFARPTSRWIRSLSSEIG